MVVLSSEKTEEKEKEKEKEEEKTEKVRLEPRQDTFWNCKPSLRCFCQADWEHLNASIRQALVQLCSSEVNRSFM